MFTIEERERLRDWLLQRAHDDPRILAAAAVGSSAVGGDRCSDIDLTVAVRDEVPVADVMAGSTEAVRAEFDAAVQFDLPAGPSIYRVFLLPGSLQVDLSFTPASAFGATGPRFHLLFGEAVERTQHAPPASDQVFGLGVHHVVRARICIQRGRLWQAEYWIRGIRDQALILACRRLGLESSHGRGYDGLPAEVLDPLRDGLVRDITPLALRQALQVATAALLREAGEMPELQASWLRDGLNAMVST